MTGKSDFITVTVRSFIFPYEPLEDFDLGKPFKMKIRPNTTLEELTHKILLQNVNQIGIMAVNGKVAKEDTTLAQGDKVDLYALLAGG